MWKKTFMVIVIALAPMIFADPPLVGRWIEDESLRTGLYDFLWARGKSYYYSKRSINQKTLSGKSLKVNNWGATGPPDFE